MQLTLTRTLLSRNLARPSSLLQSPGFGLSTKRHTTPNLLRLTRSASSAIRDGAAPMRVVTIPVLGSSKNYAYLLVDKSGRAAAIDPAEPATICDAAKREGVTVDTVLTTHKHWDHAGGNDEFKKLVPGVRVIGGINDNCQGATETVRDGDEFDYHGIHVKCIETPFHTMGHICYLCTAKGAEDLIFTGDTLFVAGCGRFFEGTAQDAYGSLIEKLSKVAPATKVWCGHNYTASNLNFAKHVDPENADVQRKVTWTQEQDEQGLPTVPSTIGDELKINPFLRVHTPEMQSFTGKSDPKDVMAALRKAKDSF